MRICQNPRCGREYHPRHPDQLYCDILCADQASTIRRRQRAREARLARGQTIGPQRPLGHNESFIPLAGEPLTSVMPTVAAARERSRLAFTTTDAAQGEHDATVRELVGLAPGDLEEPVERIDNSEPPEPVEPIDDIAL